MKVYRKTLDIDGMKLKKLLAKTGKSLAEHSRECGFGEGFFSNAISRNQLNKAAVFYLERIGIEFSEYEIEVKEPIAEEVPLNEKKISDMTGDEFLSLLKTYTQDLSEAMYKAVYAALYHNEKN